MGFSQDVFFRTGFSNYGSRSRVDEAGLLTGTVEGAERICLQKQKAPKAQSVTKRAAR
jgi:hypothetical protein